MKYSGIDDPECAFQTSVVVNVLSVPLRPLENNPLYKGLPAAKRFVFQENHISLKGEKRDFNWLNTPTFWRVMIVIRAAAERETDLCRLPGLNTF